MNIFGFPPERFVDGTKRPSRYSPSLRKHRMAQPYRAGVVSCDSVRGGTTDSWLLELQHRAGPLQLAIERVRRNNLAVSALVLLLLALSIAVLSFAGYRAQNFAKLQMDFVASVSHELRTPLTAIFSAGENIKDGLIRNKSELAEYGGIVTAQSRQLMNHVDRILLFASIRSGKDRYTLRPHEVKCNCGDGPQKPFGVAGGRILCARGTRGTGSSSRSGGHVCRLRMPRKSDYQCGQIRWCRIAIST